MEDLAHILNLDWRSLHDIRKLALDGKFGKEAGVLKPFANLRITQLREELHKRGNYDTDHQKKELQEQLRGTLRGVQRVPTLLLLNPEQELHQLHLQNYAVLDSEPLHDLKGHLANLFKELPYILPTDIRKIYHEIVSANTHDKMSGADYRMVAIEVFLYFLKTSIDKNILLLIETAVRISQLLYLPEKNRTPRTVLQMYNYTWVHHELCSKLFPATFHGDLTRGRFFGSYLHALVAHAPIQLEIISLWSVNTENQERLFSQARKTAIAATNRQPQNVISSTLLRLQAKTEYKNLLGSVQEAESRVAKAGKNVPKYSGTTITTDFLHGKLKSWQANLQRMSHFLGVGEGVWWEKVPSGYHFFDGDDDAESHHEGPTLLHFRCSYTSDCMNNIINVMNRCII